MNLNDIKSVYFVGIGGIGMSAIARYFLHKGLTVGGYDKTPSDLTRKLQEEGALIHYCEDVEQIPAACKNHTCHTCGAQGTGIFPRERVRNTKTCPGSGYTYPLPERSLCGRYTRKDDNQQYGCSPIAPKSCGLQRLPWRNNKELRDKLYPQQRESLCSDRS